MESRDVFGRLQARLTESTKPKNHSATALPSRQVPSARRQSNPSAIARFDSLYRATPTPKVLQGLQGKQLPPPRTAPLPRNVAAPIKKVTNTTLFKSMVSPAPQPRTPFERAPSPAVHTLIGSLDSKRNPVLKPLVLNPENDDSDDSVGSEPSGSPPDSPQVALSPIQKAVVIPMALPRVVSPLSSSTVTQPTSYSTPEVTQESTVTPTPVSFPSVVLKPASPLQSPQIPLQQSSVKVFSPKVVKPSPTAFPVSMFTPDSSLLVPSEQRNKFEQLSRTSGVPTTLAVKDSPNLSRRKSAGRISPIPKVTPSPPPIASRRTRRLSVSQSKSPPRRVKAVFEPTPPPVSTNILDSPVRSSPVVYNHVEPNLVDSPWIGDWYIASSDDPQVGVRIVCSSTGREIDVVARTEKRVIRSVDGKVYSLEGSFLREQSENHFSKDVCDRFYAKKGFPKNWRKLLARGRSEDRSSRTSRSRTPNLRRATSTSPNVAQEVAPIFTNPESLSAPTSKHEIAAQPIPATAPDKPVKRGRGRPRKYPRPSPALESTSDGVDSGVPTQPVKRGRGRPRKYPRPTPEPNVLESVSVHGPGTGIESVKEEPKPVKRGRGRPRKTPKPNPEPKPEPKTPTAVEISPLEVDDDHGFIDTGLLSPVSSFYGDESVDLDDIQDNEDEEEFFPEPSAKKAKIKPVKRLVVDADPKVPKKRGRKPGSKNKPKIRVASGSLGSLRQGSMLPVSSDEDAGVKRRRRSGRVHVKPLDYWRNERMIDGEIVGEGNRDLPRWMEMLPPPKIQTKSEISSSKSTKSYSDPEKSTRRKTRTKKPSKHTEDYRWNEELDATLLVAHKDTNCDREFWVNIARVVGHGLSAKDCQDRYQTHLFSTPKKRKDALMKSKVDDLTPHSRQRLETITQTHTDDVFDSTPMRKSKAAASEAMAQVLDSEIIDDSDSEESDRFVSKSKDLTSPELKNIKTKGLVDQYIKARFRKKR